MEGLLDATEAAASPASAADHALRVESVDVQCCEQPAALTV